MAPRKAADPELLLLSVELDGNAEAYVAKVRVDGRKHGERTLRAAGPTCDSLRDALVVTLLVLLDEESSAALDAPTTRSVETTALPKTANSSALTTATYVPREESPVTTPATPAAPGNRHRQPASMWLALGGGLTHGLPHAWSGALLADLSVRFLAFEVSAGGLWAPSQRITTATEDTEVVTTVGVSGGRMRGCYAWRPAAPTGPRVLGCATAVIAALSGAATGTELEPAGSKTVPWWLAGASAEATLPLTERIDAGISAAALATLHKEVFTIDPLAPPYETDAVVAVVALRLEARLF
jgi:hypothetical protein